MLIDVPMTAWLEQPVQKLDILLGLRDAAEAKDTDNAVDASRLNLAIPRRGIIDRFNTDGDDLVDVIYTNVLDTLSKRFGRNGVGFDTVNLGDVATCGFPVAKTVCIVGAVGILAKTSKNICPHATSGADLEDGTINRSAHDLVMDNTILDTTFKKGNNSLLSIGLYIWPDGSPECAEQGFTESSEGEESAIILGTNEFANGRRDMREGDGHESPWIYKLVQDLSDGGQDGHGERGRGRPSALRGPL